MAFLMLHVNVQFSLEVGVGGLGFSYDTKRAASNDL